MDLSVIRRKLGYQDTIAGASADQSIPVDQSERTTAPSISGLMGPRGRDESGENVVIPPGLPPTAIPGGGYPERWFLKEHDYPFPTPPQLTRVPFTVVGALSGVVLDKQVGHPIRGVIISNYSPQWLLIPSVQKYISPFTALVAFPLHGSPSSFRVVAEPPPGFTQPALVTGAGFEASLVEIELPVSPGIPIQTQGGAPSSAAATLVQIQQPADPLDVNVQEVGDVPVPNLSDTLSGSEIVVPVGAAVQVFNTASGNLERLRTATWSATALVSATTATVLHTPATGKKFRLLGWHINVPGNAISAGGAEDTLTFLDSATPIDWSMFFAPTAVVASLGLNDYSIGLGENGILSAAANNVLNVILSAALVGNTNVRVTAYGDDE